MSELAYNLSGEPFEVPNHAAGWRVRRMKPKGAPEVVYGRNGQPLVLPIESDIDDLRSEAGAAGRYRLDPVDTANRPIADAPAGYVFVHEERIAPAEARPAHQHPAQPAHAAGTELIVIEAMRMNVEATRMAAEIAREVVGRFPRMLESAAMLVQAADGAGLPAREPRVFDGGEDDDERGADDAPAVRTGVDFGVLLGQLAPLLMAALSTGKLKVPIGELFDWRKAAQAAPSAPSKTAKPAPAIDASKPAGSTKGEGSAAKSTEATSAGAASAPIPPEKMAHVVAVLAALKPDEAALAREIAAELSASERDAWFAELSALSVPECVAKIRALIHGGDPKQAGGAS